MIYTNYTVSKKKLYFADREERDQEGNLIAVNIVTNPSLRHFLFCIISECIQGRNPTAAHSAGNHLRNWALYDVIRKSTQERNHTAAHNARSHLPKQAPYNAIRKSTLERILHITWLQQEIFSILKLIWANMQVINNEFDRLKYRHICKMFTWISCQ